MSAPQLGIDPEDLRFNVLPAVERSFGIRFTDGDFHQDFTYGELHALVLARLPQTPVADCTTQQAFYQVRRLLRLVGGNADIRPGSRLADLLPTNPRPAAATLQTTLGLSRNLIGMPDWVAISGTWLIVAALGLFFFSWQLALSLLALVVMGLDTARQLGRTLQFTTVRELVLHLSTYHYRQSRRHPDTVNPREVKSHLDALFAELVGVEPATLLPETVL